MRMLGRMFWAGLLLLLVLPGPSSAESVEDIEERRAVGFVKALKTGDADALVSFMHENWAPVEPGNDRANQRERIARVLTERHPNVEIVIAPPSARHVLGGG